MADLDPANYHVAWIAPLWIEQVAAIQMLDDLHPGSFPHTHGRQYQVTAGRIGRNNVIIATLAGEYGNVSAADLASEIRNRFPKLQLSLLVGIAAGLPLLPDRDIRLGDVLVAVPSQSNAGIVAYTLGKATPDGFVELQTLAQTDGHVRSLVTMIRGEWEGPRSRPDLGQRIKFQSHYNEIATVEHGVRVEGYPKDFSYPGSEQDKGPQIPMALPGHVSEGDTVVEAGDRTQGSDSKLLPTRDKHTHVWYGSIGTGGELVKRASRSSELRAKHNIIGLEMEAYGTMSGLRTGVIRGVCDYADEGKNKSWQPYAAAIAAAYAKTMIIRAGNVDPDREEKGAVHCATKYPRQPSLAPHMKEEGSPILLVKFDRNFKTLVHRQYIYDSISESFKSGNRVALWGLGGVGKSRIAIEFLYRTITEDPKRSIYWISAASASHFFDSLRDIVLEIPEKTLDSLKELNASSAQGDNKSLDIPQIVRDWLSSPKSGPWLVVLDNVDTSEILDKTGTGKRSYFQCIPKSKNGRLLMTTRSRGIAEQITDNDSALINVTAMTLSEAVELFHNSLPNDDTPVAEVEELAKTLDYLPLAIKQAIAFIRSFKPMTSIGKYLIKFRADEEQLLKREFSDAVRDSDDLTNAVVVTWQINFNQISAIRDSTTKVISCLAVLDREAVPTFLLEKLLGQQDLVEDIGLLAQYSFIVAAASPAEEPGERIWSVHRLVHRTMQIWLRNRKQNEKWEKAVLALLANAFDLATKMGTWWKARLLLPHLRSSLSYPSASGVKIAGLRRLVSEFERPTWLSMREERSESERVQATQQAIEGTCEWLFTHPLFRDWLPHGQSRLLFLFGSPGSGKTTLCSRTVKYLSQGYGREDKVRTLYFYSSRRCHRFLDFAMTLLSQLCADSDDLSDGLRFNLAALSAAEGRSSTESVTSALKLALRETSQTVYIIADGLDEPPSLEMKQFLDFIASLQVDTSIHGTHVMIASRPIPEVRSFASEFAVIDISAQEMSVQTLSDIDRLIHDSIDKWELPEHMDDFKVTLADIIATRSNGSMVWAKYTLDFIAEEVAQGSSLAEVKDRLQLEP